MVCTSPFNTADSDSIKPSIINRVSVLDACAKLPKADEKVTTTGLVRGMAAQLATTGRTPQGFDLVMTSDIPSGGGLSSSAALELAIGRVMETLWEGPTVNAPTLARMGQISEQRYFGKPCGLMDQMSVAVGGIAHMSFLDPENPVVTRLDFDFERSSYAGPYSRVPADVVPPVEAPAALPAADETCLDFDFDHDDYSPSATAEAITVEELPADEALPVEAGTILGAGLLTAVALASSDEGFATAARLLFLAHLPIMLAEGLITMITVGFIARVRPEMLRLSAS